MADEREIVEIGPRGGLEDPENLPPRPTDEEWADAHETYVADLAAAEAADQLKIELEGLLSGAKSDVANQRQEDDADLELLDKLEAQLSSFETRLRAIYIQYRGDDLAKILSHEMPEEIYEAIKDALNCILAQEAAKEDKTPEPTLEEVTGEFRIIFLAAQELLADARDRNLPPEILSSLENNAEEILMNLVHLRSLGWAYSPEQLAQLEEGAGALYEQILRNLRQNDQE